MERTMQQQCLPIWGELFVHGARAHAIPDFTQQARDSPGDGVRRRKSETDFQNRFSEEGHVGFHARRAGGKGKIMHACKRTCQGPCQQTQHNTITGWRLRGLRKLRIQGFLRVEDAGGVFLSVAL